MIDVYTIELGPLGTKAFLLFDESLKEAILIDAPQGSWKRIEPFLKQKNCRLSTLLLTHGHWDHIVDARAFQNAGARVYAHPNDRILIENPMTQAAFLNLQIQLEAAQIDSELTDGQILTLLGQSIEVRHVPGHCPGNVLFYFKALGWAFVGDVIFAGSIGRYDFPGCSKQEIERSIKEKVYTLPGATTLCPGHGPLTTVEREKTTNPYVKPD